jgi:hypothetical protein
VDTVPTVSALLTEHKDATCGNDTELLTILVEHFFIHTYICTRVPVPAARPAPHPYVFIYFLFFYILHYYLLLIITYYYLLHITHSYVELRAYCTVQ